MEYIKELPNVAELYYQFPLTQQHAVRRKERIQEIKHILSGKDERKLLLVGPCSADQEDSVTEYCIKLASLQERVSDKFLIIPRVYTSKPRTKGTGYKGILHNPNAQKEDDLLSGVIATRKIHLRVIEQTGLFCVDEMLYPEEIQYILDLLCYVAVGARSVEDQGHRMVASGIDIPVGLKNPMSGNLPVLTNSISAAQHSHHMIYGGWEVKTEGNPFAHGIMRGFVDMAGRDVPNYHYENLCEFYDLSLKSEIENPAVIVDCNHSNSGKKYDEQMRIAQELIFLCSNYLAIGKFLKGIMIESYLVDGAQLIGGGVYGKSITDPCLGWEKTERLILSLADYL